MMRGHLFIFALLALLIVGIHAADWDTNVFPSCAVRSSPNAVVSIANEHLLDHL